MSVDAHIQRKVVPGAGWNANEREAVGPCGRGHDAERSVAAGHAERIGSVGNGFVDEGYEVVVRTEDEGLDASLARPLDEPCPRSPAAAGPRVDEQDRSTDRLGRSPAVPGQISHDQLILWSGRRSDFRAKSIGFCGSKHLKRSGSSVRDGRAPRVDP
jgi:hypothetical protein